MDITVLNLKWHIVAELLIIKFARSRNIPVPEVAQNFWIYYRSQLEEADYNIDAVISNDVDMVSFYAEWEEYNTVLSEDEVRLPVITLAMKLVMAKALKYADDLTLKDMIEAINSKLTFRLS